MRNLVSAFLLTLVIVGVLAVVGGRGAVSYVLGLVVVGYLMWRAWPAVTRDVAVVARHLSTAPPRDDR